MKIYNLAYLFLFLYAFATPIADSQQKLNINKTGAANLVFKSTDGGQSWQDISEGLPENWEGDGFFANESKLYVSASNGIYRNSQNFTAPFWEKEIFPDDHNRIAPGKTGIFAYKIFTYNWDGQFLQKINGTDMWSPMFTNFQVSDIRTVYETAKGTLFIGTDYRLYKSTDRGKTWKQVYIRGLVMKLVESNGVLMATSQTGILRSIDDGENWDCVLNEGGVGIAVEPIKDGFATIVYNTQLKARTVRVTYDYGKTWQPIDTGLPAVLNTASIIQVGDNFFCGHPAGIFRSSDKGKTWKLLLPSIGNKVFNLSVSGNVIYAIPRAGGC